MSKARAKGTCRDCDAPRVMGSIRCESHRLEAAERARLRNLATNGARSRQKTVERQAARERGELPPIRRGPQKKIGPSGEPWCARCKRFLPRDDFPASHDQKGGYCKQCNSEYGIEHRLMTVYGMTVEEYDTLLAMQNIRCAICEAKPRKARLAVDHNHKTGEVRGLLCSRCNHKLLGSAKESPELLRRAALYLERPPARVGSIAQLGPSLLVPKPKRKSRAKAKN